MSKIQSRWFSFPKGRVCVPINPNSPDLFDPFNVPTVSDLIDQINAYDANHPEQVGSENAVPDWKKTELTDGVLLFEKFVNKLKIAQKSHKDAIEDIKMEF